MDQEQPQFAEVGTGTKRRRIAYRWDQRQGNTALVWLSGFRSDMTGTKVAALSEWARQRHLSMLRFDYSAHGESDGVLTEATIGDWLEESIAMYQVMSDHRAIVVGSSMGGWLALLLARHLAARSKPLGGLVLIAPAFDMTEALMWRAFTPEMRTAVETEGVYVHPSDYGESYPITRGFIEEGRNHLLENSPFDPCCPVRIIQGMRDPDVPWRHALALVDLLQGDDVELTLVKAAEHRLSDPQDLRRLEVTIEALLGACEL